MNVEPDDEIDPKYGAQISHDGAGTLVVTIKNEDGVTVSVEVPEGQTITWYPPKGWKTATFQAAGNSDEYRTILQEADEEA